MSPAPLRTCIRTSLGISTNPVMKVKWTEIYTSRGGRKRMCQDRNSMVFWHRFIPWSEHVSLKFIHSYTRLLGLLGGGAPGRDDVMVTLLHKWDKHPFTLHPREFICSQCEHGLRIFFDVRILHLKTERNIFHQTLSADASRWARNKILLFINYPVCSFTAAKMG